MVGLWWYGAVRAPLNEAPSQYHRIARLNDENVGLTAAVESMIPLKEKLGAKSVELPMSVFARPAPSSSS